MSRGQCEITAADTNHHPRTRTVQVTWSFSLFRPAPLVHCKVPDTREALSCLIGVARFSLTLWAVQEDVGRLSEISQALYDPSEHVQEEATREFPKLFSPSATRRSSKS
jgi:hypothetical protein